MKEPDDFILFGLDAISYGIYFDGQNFDMRNSTGKKHYTTSRKLAKGDCITVLLDPQVFLQVCSSLLATTAAAADQLSETSE